MAGEGRHLTPARLQNSRFCNYRVEGGHTRRAKVEPSLQVTADALQYLAQLTGLGKISVCPAGGQVTDVAVNKYVLLGFIFKAFEVRLISRGAAHPARTCVASACVALTQPNARI